MKLLHSTAIALLIVTGITTVVHADELVSDPFQIVDVKTATINFADLDLNNPADAQTLLDRINKTTRIVCQRIDTGTGLEEMKATRLCFADSYKNGIVAINSKKNVDIEAIAARARESREVVTAD